MRRSFYNDGQILRFVYILDPVTDLEILALILFSLFSCQFVRCSLQWVEGTFRK